MEVDWFEIAACLHIALVHTDKALEEMGDEVEHIAAGLREHRDGIERHMTLAENKANNE